MMFADCTIVASTESVNWESMMKVVFFVEPLCKSMQNLEPKFGCRGSDYEKNNRASAMAYCARL